MDQLVKHKLPLKGQLAIALGYFFFLFSLSTIEGDSDAGALLSSPHMINMMKMVQLVSVLLVFILPVVGFTMLLRSEKTAFLNLGKTPGRIPFITAATICIIAMPAVAGMEIWNAGLHLPPSMSGIEEWMKIKEKSAEVITNAFFMDKSTMGLIINLFVVAFMAAFSEELFFRGLIQRLFIDNKMNIHVAVWLTAFLFSAFHMQFFGFVPRLFLGAALGYLYVYSGNLWVPIIAHFVNNGFQVLMVHLMDLPAEGISAKTDQQIGFPTVLLSIVMVATQIWFLRRDYIRKQTVQ